MKHYLVSVIECDGEEDNNFFTDFRLFSSRKEAEDYYNNNLKEFLPEKGDDFELYDSHVEKRSDFQRNTYTWEWGINHWEIILSEVEEK